MSDTAKGCPKCGCETFFSKFIGTQYYKANGENDGYHFDGKETKTVRCLKCHYRTTLDKLRERAKKNETT